MSIAMATTIVTAGYLAALAPLLLAFFFPRLTTTALIYTAVVVSAAVGAHLVWSFSTLSEIPLPSSQNPQARAQPTSDYSAAQLEHLLQTAKIECSRVINIRLAEAADERLVTCLRESGSREQITYILNTKKRSLRLSQS